MSRYTALTAFMLLGACAGDPQGAAEFDDDILDIRCGVLIDGRGGEPRRDQLVSIRGDRIVAVADLGGSPADAELDLSEFTCLPGLIDTHAHFATQAEDSSDMTVYYRRSTAESTRLAEDNALKMLEAGFTTARNVGDYFPAVVTDIRRRIDAGEIPGPRIQTAGPYLTIPGGGGDLVIPGVDEALIPPGARLGVARGPEEFAARTQAAIDQGAEFIKIIASGAVFAFGGVPGEPEMTPEEIAAVVRVAHAKGIKVTAHAHGAQSIKDAIRAGVDSIEHASLADDEAIALAAARGVAFSMDVYNGTYTAEVGEELGFPEEFMRKNDETTEAQRIVLEKAHAAGVPILFGTDAGVYPHGLNARQFAVMVERGMTPMAAILSATSVPAEHMGLAADIGKVEAGRYADLIAVRGDPLADIRVLENVTVVLKGGEVVKSVDQ